MIFSKTPKTLLNNLPTAPKPLTIPRKFVISLRLTDLNNKTEGTKTIIKIAVPKTSSTKLEKLKIEIAPKVTDAAIDEATRIFAEDSQSTETP